MNLNEYQKRAKTTQKPECANLSYLGLGLAGEAGEVTDKLKRIWRGDQPKHTDIAIELGDVLWYVAMLADHFGYSLQNIADMNIAKLASRQARGVLSGKGDNR